MLDSVRPWDATQKRTHVSKLLSAIWPTRTARPIGDVHWDPLVVARPNAPIRASDPVKCAGLTASRVPVILRRT